MSASQSVKGSKSSLSQVDEEDKQGTDRRVDGVCKVAVWMFDHKK